MKTKLLTLILLIYSFNLAAQQKINTSFGTQISSTFENLEKNRVTQLGYGKLGKKR